MTKRRKFKPDLKAQVVLESLTGVKSQVEICREHRLRPQTLSRWKAEFLERAPMVFETKQNKDKDQERIAELERMVGRLACVGSRRDDHEENFRITSKDSRRAQGSF